MYSSIIDHRLTSLILYCGGEATYVKMPSARDTTLTTKTPRGTHYKLNP
jgi:hypothetical protein